MGPDFLKKKSKSRSQCFMSRRYEAIRRYLVLPFRPLQVAAAHIFLNTFVNISLLPRRRAVFRNRIVRDAVSSHKRMNFFFFCPFSRFLSFQYEKEKRIETVRYKVTWKGGKNNLEGSKSEQ
jgi:hypothetical protein